MSGRGRTRALRVHVCLDQPLADGATSGLVRTWLRFFEEAARHEDLDVTGHALAAGDDRTTVVAPNVRLREHARPRLTSELVNRLGIPVPATVGLFPYRRSLARELRGADVIHTTYTLLSFAMTALVVSRRSGKPLTTSLQTEVPAHAEIYARAAAERLLGRGLLRRPLVVERRLAAAVRRALEGQARWYFRRCRRVFISTPGDRAALPEGFPPSRVVYLPRGIDTATFHPRRRDRARLARRFGIAEGEPVILYVGKLLPEKGVPTLAHALERLRAGGERFTLLAVGRGAGRADLERRLGPRAVFAGVQPHDELGWISASADVLAFPSSTETFANVVVEAMASGLAPIVSAAGGAPQHVRRPGEDGIVVAGDDPAPWAEALRMLLRDPARRRRIGAAARRRIETGGYTGWDAIFDRIVKPGWVGAAAEVADVREPARRLEPVPGDDFDLELGAAPATA